jgi:hypothetical protein
MAMLPLAAGISTQAATFVDDASADSRLFSLSPDEAEGTQGFLAIFREPGNAQNTIIQFDLSTIPEGSTINSATLSLSANSNLFPDGNLGGASMDVYRVTRTWTENEVTWNSAETGTAWTNPGGDYVGTTGVRDASPYASNETTLPNNYGVLALEWDITSLVTEWLEGTSPNNGLLVRSFDGNHLHFTSTEHPTGPGPSITVDFTPVPEPIHIALLSSLALCGLAVYRRTRQSVA